MSKHAAGIIASLVSDDDDPLQPPSVIRASQREFNDHFGHEEYIPEECQPPYEFSSPSSKPPVFVLPTKIKLAPPPLTSSFGFLTEGFAKPGSGKSLPDLAALLKTNVSERVLKLQEKRKREEEEKAAIQEEEQELREARLAEARVRKLKAEREAAEETARLALVKLEDPRAVKKLRVTRSAVESAAESSVGGSGSGAGAGAGAGASFSVGFGAADVISRPVSSGIHSLKDFKNARENDNFKNSAVGVIHGISFRLVFPRNSCHTLTDRGSRWAAMQRGVDKTSPKAFECVLARNFEHFQFILARANGGNEKFALKLYANFRMLNAVGLQPRISACPSEPEVSLMNESGFKVRKDRQPKIRNPLFNPSQKSSQDEETLQQIHQLQQICISAGINSKFQIPSMSEMMRTFDSILNPLTSSSLQRCAIGIGEWWDSVPAGFESVFSSLLKASKLLTLYDFLIQKAYKNSLSVGSLSGILVPFDSHWSGAVDELSVRDSKKSSDRSLKIAFYGNSDESDDESDDCDALLAMIDSAQTVPAVPAVPFQPIEKSESGFTNAKSRFEFASSALDKARSDMNSSLYVSLFQKLQSAENLLEEIQGQDDGWHDEDPEEQRLNAEIRELTDQMRPFQNSLALATTEFNEAKAKFAEFETDI